MMRSPKSASATSSDRTRRCDRRREKSINRAFSYMLAEKSEMGIARELDVSDPRPT